MDINYRENDKFYREYIHIPSITAGFVKSRFQKLGEKTRRSLSQSRNDLLVIFRRKVKSLFR